MPAEGRPRILFASPSDASFIRIDRELIAERWPLQEWRQPGRFTNLARLWPMLRRCDVVVGWWASWPTFFPVVFGRRPSLLIVGGFDTADMPEIGYGFQQGGPRRWLSRLVMRRATRLVTNSYYSRRGGGANAGVPPDRGRGIHHRVARPHGGPPGGGRPGLAARAGLV